MDVFANGWLSKDGGKNFIGEGSSWSRCGPSNQEKRGFGRDATYWRRWNGTLKCCPSGRKRYHCVAIKTDGNGNLIHGHMKASPNRNDYIKYNANDQGNHPCKGLGESTIIQKGGAITGEFGFKCTVPAGKLTGQNLINWSTNNHMLQAGIVDGGKQRSLYHQLLLGVSSSLGNTTNQAVCRDVKNLAKVVHKDGKTCFQYIQGEIGKVEADRLGRAFCSNNRTDPKCKCINTQGAGNQFIPNCARNPSWAGCKEVNDGIASFKALGLESMTGMFGQVDCIVPGICSGDDQYAPEHEVKVCQNKTGICQQAIYATNITAFGNLNMASDCKIDFTEEQAKRDRSIKEQADKAIADKKAADKKAADKAAAAKAAAAAPAAASTTNDKELKELEEQADEAKEAVDTDKPEIDTEEIDPETGAPIDPGSGQPIIESEAIPEVLMIAGIPMDTTTMLIGGGFLFCCMLLLLVMVSGRGGGGGGGGGRRR